MSAFRLGLTGSIGMGKSTTSTFFAEKGVPVWDADAAVHHLYQSGQPAALAVGQIFPDCLTQSGAVDRALLRAKITADPTLLDRLNAAVHPLIAEDRAQFLAQNASAQIVLLDVPLLFETGLDATCDAVAVVSVPAEVQKERVLARGMSEAEFQMILARQIPDKEKRDRADYIIPTTDIDTAKAAVEAILADIKSRIAQNA